MGRPATRPARTAHEMDATSGDSARTTGPETDAVLHGLAEAHAAWQQGDRPRAFALLTALAASAPANAAVLARAGAYALDAGRNADALQWLDRAVALARVDAAVAAYRQALALDPRSLAGHVNLANALEQVGDVDAAVAALEAACA